jgi:hypothetical protein
MFIEWIVHASLSATLPILLIPLPFTSNGCETQRFSLTTWTWNTKILLDYCMCENAVWSLHKSSRTMRGVYIIWTVGLQTHPGTHESLTAEREQVWKNSQYEFSPSWYSSVKEREQVQKIHNILLQKDTKMAKTHIANFLDLFPFCS